MTKKEKNQQINTKNVTVQPTVVFAFELYFNTD